MIKQLTIVILSGLMLYSGLVHNANAAVISTDQVLAAETRAARIAGIQASLAREDVQQALIQLGVDPAQARARVASLNDAELARLEGQVDSLPAGGGVLVLVGAVFVVLIILELTGAINIFRGP